MFGNIFWKSQIASTYSACLIIITITGTCILSKLAPKQHV